MDTCCWVVYARFMVKNGHQKDICYNEIGVYIKSIDIIMKLIVYWIGKAWAALWSLKKKKKSSFLASCSFCISTPILKCKGLSTWYAIAKPKSEFSFPNLIQRLRLLKYIVPTIGSHTWSQMGLEWSFSQLANFF